MGLLPDDAWIVNVARGGHIVTDDLVSALTRHSIGGAALDVTDPEPLPDGHPLWSLPNCLITPHIGNTPEMGLALLAPLSRRTCGASWNTGTCWPQWTWPSATENQLLRRVDHR